MNLREKMSNKKNNGIGFFSLLTILFIGLKLTKNIDWSWWWVLSPILIPIAFIIILLIIVLLADYNI